MTLNISNCIVVLVSLAGGGSAKVPFTITITSVVVILTTATHNSKIRKSIVKAMIDPNSKLSFWKAPTSLKAKFVASMEY